MFKVIRLIAAIGSGLALALLCAVPAAQSAGAGTAYAQSAQPYAPSVLTPTAYLPLVWGADLCAPIPDESYGTLTIVGQPSNTPVELHPDMNLAVRGYTPTTAYLGLVDYGGGTDPKAPQLAGLCASGCTPPFSSASRVYHWDWENNQRAGPITNPPVTLVGMNLAPGTTVHVPESGYTIGSGYEVLVLYASTDRITLKYTREDNVIYGYTLHIENICVEPRLLALYEQMNAAGRTSLPALRSGQAFGRARGEIGVAIRDCGAFLDPRSRKDWWQGW